MAHARIPSRHETIRRLPTHNLIASTEGQKSIAPILILFGGFACVFIGPVQRAMRQASPRGQDKTLSRVVGWVARVRFVQRTLRRTTRPAITAEVCNALESEPSASRI